jgi:uncharacterized protein (UPF0332 family)
MKDALRDCFRLALKEEEKGMKHKGLLIVEPSVEEAKKYLERAQESIRFCEIYKKMEADYKIPEEWFYSLYYCALAILAKFGVESRSQKCTALFLEYVQAKEIIIYDKEFVKRITVHKEKGIESDVDEREKARYGHWIKDEGIKKQYEERTVLCKKAIEQATSIVFSPQGFKVPEELLE